MFRLGLLIIIASFSQSLLADPVRVYVETIHHRPAAELIPLIQPFVSKQTVIRSHGSELIIKADYANYKIARQLIRRFDQAAKRYKVSLVYSQQRLNLQGGQLTRVDVINSESRRTTQQSRSLLISAGQVAWFRTGFEIPVVTQQHDGYGRRQTSLDYKKIQSGFYIKVTVQGEHATVQLSSRKQNLSRRGGQIIHSQGIQTQVRARLNHWILVSGIGSHANTSTQSIIVGTHKRKENQANLYLKIEQLDH